MGLSSTIRWHKFGQLLIWWHQSNTSTIWSHNHTGRVSAVIVYHATSGRDEYLQHIKLRAMIQYKDVVLSV